ncbi:hypothetical protein ACH4NI_35260 [Streptomyces olivaceus]|uniref:hypothetical protein n=1 Tax=Streptomyces olivaceus TaxID=47716 RepID=UPI00379236EB
MTKSEQPSTEQPQSEEVELCDNPACVESRERDRQGRERDRQVRRQYNEAQADAEEMKALLREFVEPFEALEKYWAARAGA